MNCTVSFLIQRLYLSMFFFLNSTFSGLSAFLGQKDAEKFMKMLSREDKLHDGHSHFVNMDNLTF